MSPDLATKAYTFLYMYICTHIYFTSIYTYVFNTYIYTVSFSHKFNKICVSTSEKMLLLVSLLLFEWRKYKTWGLLVHIHSKGPGPNSSEHFICQINYSFSKHKHRQSGEQIECNPEEKDLGILAVENPNLTHECAFAAPEPWAAWKAAWPAEDVILLLFSCLTRLHLEYCVQVWDPQCNKYVSLLEWVQGRPWRCSEGWTTSAVETGWDSQGCSAWRREGFRETLEHHPVPKGATGDLEMNFGKGMEWWDKN